MDHDRWFCCSVWMFQEEFFTHFAQWQVLTKWFLLVFLLGPGDLCFHVVPHGWPNSNAIWWLTAPADSIRNRLWRLIVAANWSAMFFQQPPWTFGIRSIPPWKNCTRFCTLVTMFYMMFQTPETPICCRTSAPRLLFFTEIEQLLWVACVTLACQLCTETRGMRKLFGAVGHAQHKA